MLVDVRILLKFVAPARAVDRAELDRTCNRLESPEFERDLSDLVRRHVPEGVQVRSLVVLAITQPE